MVHHEDHIISRKGREIIITLFSHIHDELILNLINKIQNESEKKKHNVIGLPRGRRKGEYLFF